MYCINVDSIKSCHGKITAIAKHQETRTKMPALFSQLQTGCIKAEGRTGELRSFLVSRTKILPSIVTFWQVRFALFWSLTLTAALKEIKRTDKRLQEVWSWGGEGGTEAAELCLDDRGKKHKPQKIFCSQSKVREMAGRGPGTEGATVFAKSKAKETWYPTAQAGAMITR